jgi:hypothetical protein
MNMDVKSIIETTLKTEIVKALNAAPEAIEALVKAALEQPVYSDGAISKQYGFGEQKMPYLDWLVGDQIRMAARRAVQEVVEENKGKIHEAVKRRMSADDLADAFAKHLIAAADQEWKIDIKFAAEKESR